MADRITRNVADLFLHERTVVTVVMAVAMVADNRRETTLNQREGGLQDLTENSNVLNIKRR